MRKLTINLLISPLMIVVSSFGGPGDNDSLEFDITTFPTPPTTINFINDAYKFRQKEKLPIPSHYYAILGIPDPTTPIIVVPPTFKDSVPHWIRKGQLMRESSSYYNADGTIKYVNKNRGGNNNTRKGAIGPFQVLRCAFDHMKKEHPDVLRGRKYEEMQKNLKLNEEVACMYLSYIYNGRGNQNWDTTIMLYNVGPWGTIDRDSRDYLKAVKKFGKSE